MQYFTFLWILISFSRASSISFGNEKVNKINPSQQKMNWNNSSLRRKLRRRKKRRRRRRWRREEWMKNPNEQGDHQFHRSGGYNVLTARRHFTLYRVNRWQANLLLFCPIHSSTSAHVPSPPPPPSSIPPSAPSLEPTPQPQPPPPPLSYSLSLSLSRYLPPPPYSSICFYLSWAHFFPLENCTMAAIGIPHILTKHCCQCTHTHTLTHKR